MSGLLSERDFVILWLVNLVAAVLYLLVGALVVSPLRMRKEKKAKVEVRHDNRRTYLLRFLVMALCPVVGPLFFMLSYLLFRLPLWLTPNLADVVFSKERAKTYLKADEERERDMIQLRRAIAGEEEGESGVELELLPYMDSFLKQRVFSALEQKKQVGIMADTAQSLFDKAPAQLTEAIYESVCLRLLEVGEFARSEVWCGRLSAQYPDSLAAYTCRLKLYFSTKNREAFFDTLAELKRSPVVIDGETLELIKVFS